MLPHNFFPRVLTIAAQIIVFHDADILCILYLYIVYARTMHLSTQSDNKNVLSMRHCYNYAINTLHFVRMQLLWNIASILRQEKILVLRHCSIISGLETPHHPYYISYIYIHIPNTIVFSCVDEPHKSYQRGKSLTKALPYVTISPTMSLTMPSSTMEFNEFVDDEPATCNDRQRCWC